MPESTYHEGRIKMTRKIERVLLTLIQKEEDVERKKKYPTKWYRDEAAKELGLKGKNNPSLRTYQNEIKLIKEHVRGKGLLDKPWTILSIGNHPIPPEGLSVVLKVWANLLGLHNVSRRIQFQAIGPGFEKDKTDKIIKQLAGNHPLTIREALWISRIHCIIKQTPSESDNEYLFRLWDYSQELALQQRIFIIQKEYPKTLEDIIYFWHSDAKLYQALAKEEAEEMQEKAKGMTIEKRRFNRNAK